MPCDDCSWQIHYGRFADGISVASDYLELSVGVDPVNQEAMRATFVDLRCHEDPSINISSVPGFQFNSLKSHVALMFGVSVDNADFQDVELKYVFEDGAPYLAWTTYVKFETAEEYYVIIDANSGEVLSVVDAFANSSYTGDVQLYIKKPYSSGLEIGALAFSNMSNSVTGTCSTSYGTTDENGEYFNVDLGANDEFRCCLKGPYSINGLGYVNFLSEFECDAGVSCTLGEFTAEKDQKRAETFYYLNYANTFARAGYGSIWLYDPLIFRIPFLPGTGEQGNGNYCGGCAGVGYVHYEGWCEGQDELEEEKFRFLVFHEFGHSPLYKSGNYSMATCTLCGAWWEAQADFNSYLANRYELLRLASMAGNEGCGDDSVHQEGELADFFPDDTMSQDYCQGYNHDTGNILSGVYVDLALELGWKNAYIRVFESIDEIGSSAQWNSSVNTFYDEMIETDASLHPGKSWHMTIAKAWMRHAGTGYLGGISWYDQWPDEPFPCYMIPITSVSTVIDDGPDAEMPDLSLDMNYDRDYFWFYVYEGESYHFETSNLCTNVDTYMNYIKIQSGAEVIVDCNDECDDVGPNSCVDIAQTTSNGWRAIEIHQTSGFPPSPGCYDLEVLAGDDVGDDKYNAKAIAPNNAWYTARWEDEGDVDFFKVYVKTAGGDMTLTIETCEVYSGTSPDTYISLYYQTGVSSVANDNNSGTCSTNSSLISYQVPSGYSGFYFVKVFENGSDAVGTYKIRAYLTGTGRGIRDVGGSSKASAFYMGDFPTTGRYIAADFESGADEDWFKVYLGENEHVTFHTVDLGRNTDTVMEIWDDEVTGYQYIPDNSKQWMRKDDDGGYKLKSSQIHFVAPLAGYYYVRLYPKTTLSIGEYTLFIQRMGIYEDDYPEFP